MESGVLPSLHSKCHLKILHTKFTIGTYKPPPSSMALYDTKRQTVKKLEKTGRSFSWEIKTIYVSIKTFKTFRILNDTHFGMVRGLI